MYYSKESDDQFRLLPFKQIYSIRQFGFNKGKKLLKLYEKSKDISHLIESFFTTEIKPFVCINEVIGYEELKGPFDTVMTYPITKPIEHFLDLEEFEPYVQKLPNAPKEVKKLHSFGHILSINSFNAKLTIKKPNRIKLRLHPGNQVFPEDVALMYETLCGELQKNFKKIL